MSLYYALMREIIDRQAARGEVSAGQHLRKLKYLARAEAREKARSKERALAIAGLRQQLQASLEESP